MKGQWKYRFKILSIITFGLIICLDIYFFWHLIDLYAIRSSAWSEHINRLFIAVMFILMSSYLFCHYVYKITFQNGNYVTIYPYDRIFSTSKEKDDGGIKNSHENSVFWDYVWYFLQHPLLQVAIHVFFWKTVVFPTVFPYTIKYKVESPNAKKVSVSYVHRYPYFRRTKEVTVPWEHIVISHNTCRKFQIEASDSMKGYQRSTSENDNVKLHVSVVVEGGVFWWHKKAQTTNSGERNVESQTLMTWCNDNGYLNFRDQNAD